MNWVVEWLLIAVAVGIGWWLGARQRKTLSHVEVSPKKSRYPKSFHYLFDAYDSPTLDSFIQTLDINRDTIHLHLALANYFRRKGEIEKSTAIHQNLLSHPEARLSYADRITYELAQDYMVAGLYDRAEALFLELSLSKEWKESAVESLLEIYEHEKDWGIAREKALTLDLKRNRAVQIRVAHYCCEMAERAVRRQDYGDARLLLKEALGYDRYSVRVSLLMGRLNLLQDLHEEALTELKRIEQQDAIFLVEAITMIQEACQKLGDNQKRLRILQRIWSLQPSSRIMVALATAMSEGTDGNEAIEFLLGQLDEHPTLGGVRTLLTLLMPFAESEPQRWIQIIKGVLDSLLEKSQSYCCTQCGFSGRHLHWQCPSCKSWSTVKPVPWS
jgi:lipopolysaccharide biosynthesis regulator YciM